MSSHAVKTLSLIMLPIAGGWFISAPGYEPAIAFLTALASAIAAKHVGKHPVSEAADQPAIEVEVPQTAPPHPADNYSKSVGFRLKSLREQVLQLSLREMAEFLNIQVVSTLERYEAGEEEYPLSLIKKIEEFFRINPRYVESGEGAIFLHFVLSQDSVSAFIRAGYTPILACCPSERGDLFCYQAFEKKTNGLTQLAYADRWGSFSSSGGGKSNIGYLINALLDENKSPSSVRIVQVTQEEWQATSNGAYYSKNPYFRAGSADWECMDIFDSWFDEYSKRRAKWEEKA
jgi:hypothetical protein